MEHCEHHSEFKNRIERNENDIQDLWKHLNTMKTWVILGMSSLVVQLAFLLFDKMG